MEKRGPSGQRGGTMSRRKVDKELIRQLDAAGGDASVSAAFSFEPRTTRSVIPPQDVDERVHRLLEKVEREIGIAPSRYRIYKNIGSFSVTAAPSFIRKLSEQADVATATASRQPEEMLIKPVSSEPVPGPSPERPKSSRGTKGK